MSGKHAQSPAPQPSNGLTIKGLLVVIVVTWVLYILIFDGPASNDSRRFNDCVAWVESEGLSWTDAPEYGDAIEDCEAGL